MSWGRWTVDVGSLHPGRLKVTIIWLAWISPEGPWTILLRGGTTRTFSEKVAWPRREEGSQRRVFASWRLGRRAVDLLWVAETSGD